LSVLVLNSAVYSFCKVGFLNGLRSEIKALPLWQISEKTKCL